MIRTVIFRLLTLPIVAVATLVARPSSACGGPDMGDFAALAPVDDTLGAILTDDIDGLGIGWGGQGQRPEFRFLYPLWKAHPRELDGLWHFAYDGDDKALPAPPSAPLEVALAVGDIGEGARRAGAIIEGLYALPPVAAASYAPLLWRSVEVIEMEPAMRGLPRDAVARFFGPAPAVTNGAVALAVALAARQAHDAHGPLPPAAGNPREASLGYWTFQDHLRTRIPNGWSEGVGPAVPARTWTDLEAEVDGWIARHPTHPLADLARLAKIRVLYFAGDFEGAWNQALSLYPRRRVRALAEMRYLLVAGHPPTPTFVAKLTDPALEAALTLQDGFDASRWNGLWRASEGMPLGDVRVNLQERLLAWQAANAKPGALPGSFPDRPAQPSALWGKLRAIALLRSGAAERALDQLLMLPSEPERDLLLAQVDLQTGRPDRAVESPRLSGDARAYLLGARLDDTAVTHLCQSSVPAARAAACFELALRTARAGLWSEAIPFVRIGMPQRTALWEQAVRLAKTQGPNRDLALARFFGSHSGEIVSIADNGPYRGISEIEEKLPASSPERTRIQAMLMRTTERWLALESYVRWLGQNLQSPSARDVLDEADDAYNHLVNLGGGDYFFWGRAAPKTTTVAELRRLGALIRKGPAKTVAAPSKSR